MQVVGWGMPPSRQMELHLAAAVACSVVAGADRAVAADAALWAAQVVAVSALRRVALCALLLRVTLRL